jgi:predicted transcriptional regulator
VLKTMKIMLEKGLLEREDTRRPQVYRARFSRERTQKQFVSEVLQQVYHGSLKAMVMHAAGTRKPSADDIEEIEAFLRDLKRGKK